MSKKRGYPLLCSILELENIQCPCAQDQWMTLNLCFLRKHKGKGVIIATTNVVTIGTNETPVTTEHS